MDLIHKFLIIVSGILSVISCIFVLPILSLFRILRFCIRSVLREKLAGKVVLITGASSGIGEHLAYEYAKHGASLALVARREELLATVAGKAKELGAPEAIVIKADVSKLQDCKRFVDETINHFGKLDCLVNNAGIITIGLFEEEGCITNYTSIMNVNFWGSVNATHFALPHLRNCKGRIVVIGSTGGWFNMPGISVYNASKVAQQSFFETLRIELASDIGITIVTPGVVTTPLASDEVLNESNLWWIPRYSAEDCAKAIVNSARRGDEYLTEPAWMQSVFIWVMLFPEIMNIVRRLILIASGKTSSQKWKSCNNIGSLESLNSNPKHD
ncbi:11-beta-hydroxysteroid dehydrogenase-like 4A isoform X1 [Lactuca sativa]|uniref:11-beta-hydroxysteroid dehydrogenase-like 4A isoform X1 n=1 Tax=Lactuca sativa TaxID=4236 RepID=UPI000CCABD9A|nr:11-beta-hydroxysteroid dehydrogenase-like 4A isoform X1 [Lactuca sativa]